MVEQVSGCFGCGACSLICPQRAIFMAWNSEGYQRPQVHRSCIGCGRCRQVCPACMPGKTVLIDKHSDILALRAVPYEKKSSSGGASHVLARAAIAADMPVCGVEYNDQLDCAEHVSFTQMEDLPRMQGSKYIPSCTEAGFRAALEKQSGLIFGTPCQVAGLDAVLRKEGRRESFILVDLFCHGVPSQWLWRNHIKAIRKPGQGGVNFRPEGKFCLRAGSYCRSAQVDPFYHLYLKGKVYQQACYQCPYRRSSASDLRLGDYFDGAQGRWSLAVIFTPAGKGLLEQAEPNLEKRKALWPVVDAAQQKHISMPEDREYTLAQLMQGRSPGAIMGKRKLALQYIKGAVKAVLGKK